MGLRYGFTAKNPPNPADGNRELNVFVTPPAALNVAIHPTQSALEHEALTFAAPVAEATYAQ